MNKLITNLCLLMFIIFGWAEINWLSSPPVIGGESTAVTGMMFSIFLWIIYQVIRKI